MKRAILFLLIFLTIRSFAQEDTSVVDISAEQTVEKEPTKVFYDQRLINANTVEVLRKGVMEFKVIHNFGDIGGPFGGIKNFFGLDAAIDIKISFQIGLSDKFNILAGRAKGVSYTGSPTQLWELGLKWQMLTQYDNDPAHPLSMTLYANTVASGMRADTDPANIRENDFTDFSDRLSQMVQLMIAKRFGNFSLQASPTYVHTNFVVPGDQSSVFAIGGAARLPITKKFFLIADYFHPFLDETTRETWRNRGFRLYDAFGVGVEILTEGHIFHLNFTNATSILENRFIPRTFTGWGEGKYRWGFTIARRFVLFRDKKSKE
jgi:hypothetical protein